MEAKDVLMTCSMSIGQYQQWLECLNKQSNNTNIVTVNPKYEK